MAHRPHRRPKVLFLQANPRFDADGQVHATIAARLAAHGVDALAACAPGSLGEPSAALTRFEALSDVEVLCCRFGPRRFGRRPAELLRACLEVSIAVVDMARLTVWARRRGVDVVHCTEKSRETLAAYALSRLIGAHLTVHLHVAVAPWFRRSTSWVMRRADRLVAISESVRASAIAAGYPDQQIRVALNALCPQSDPASLSPQDRDDVRAEFGLGNEARLVTIVARLNPWKGHRDLFAAVARIVPEMPDVTVLVVGGGEHRAALEAIAEDLGLAAHIRFTGFRDDALRLIHAADVFAMPSAGEPFGLVYLEAMRCNVPVVASDDGGTPEVVVDGATGLLSPAGNVDALTANLRRLLADAALRTRLGAAGRQRVDEHFQPDRLAADFAAIVAAVVGESDTVAGRTRSWRP